MWWICWGVAQGFGGGFRASTNNDNKYNTQLAMSMKTLKKNYEEIEHMRAVSNGKTISYYQRLPWPSPCNGLISTWLL